MDGHKIVAKHERAEQARKLRSDAINRILFKDNEAISSMRGELLLSRVLNVAFVLVLVIMNIKGF